MAPTIPMHGGRGSMPRRTGFRLGSALLASLLGRSALAYDFSVDPLSPEVLSQLRYGSSDIIQQDGGGVLTPGASLGIGSDELDAFSYGKDILRPVGPNSLPTRRSACASPLGARERVAYSSTGQMR